MLIGHPYLADSAARQVESYYAGRNGLATNAADDGPRLNPIPTFTWPPKETDYMSTDEAKATLARIETTLGKLTEAEKRRADNQYKREAALSREVKRLGGNVDKVLAEVTE